LIQTGKLGGFILLIVLSALVVLVIQRSRKGKVPQIRRLAGLDAIEEAIGRCAEMGRPAHFSTGWGGLSTEWAQQTIAGLSVLGYTYRIAARYKVPVFYTCCWAHMLPLVYDLGRQAYLAEGKPEEFNPDTIRYVGDSQNALMSGAMGTIAREKVAANFLIGGFFFEAIQLAEEGFAAGAIQVGGTARVYQIPTLMATCDYILIGEELFAAGAYVTRDPVQIGSIGGQDLGRLLSIIITVIAVLSVSLGSMVIINLLNI
jgi:hypothetical protein